MDNPVYSQSLECKSDEEQVPEDDYKVEVVRITK